MHDEEEVARREDPLERAAEPGGLDLHDVAEPLRERTREDRRTEPLLDDRAESLEVLHEDTRGTAGEETLCIALLRHVGERAGESIVSSATAEELQRKGAELMGKLVADSDASDRPIQIGDIVQLKGEFKVVGMREEPSPFRILNGPCFEEAGPADVVYTVQSKASTRYLVGDEIEVRASDLRRL